jgi:MFS family permease
MLFLIGTVNFVDRQLLSVLVEPIRADLHFTDTQFGLLTGLAFALFYAAMGVPVAMIADRWQRVKLIGIACVVWSAFTAACGLVGNFWQLALMRFGWDRARPAEPPPRCRSSPISTRPTGALWRSACSLAMDRSACSWVRRSAPGRQRISAGAMPFC